MKRKIEKGPKFKLSITCPDYRMKLCERLVKKAKVDYTFPNEHVLAASQDLIP